MVTDLIVNNLHCSLITPIVCVTVRATTIVFLSTALPSSTKLLGPTSGVDALRPACKHKAARIHYEHKRRMIQITTLSSPRK